MLCYKKYNDIKKPAIGGKCRACRLMIVST